MSIVEKMARAIKAEAVKLFERYGGIMTTDYANGDAVWVPAARAILTATGLTEQQLEGLANGEMVAVDAASLAEVARGYNGISIAHLHVLKVVQDAQRAMLALKEKTT